MSNVFLNPRAYVAEWIKMNQIEISPQGNLVVQGMRGRQELELTLLLDYDEQFSAYKLSLSNSPKPKRISDSKLKMAFREYSSN